MADENFYLTLNVSKKLVQTLSRDVCWLVVVEIATWKVQGSKPVEIQFCNKKKLLLNDSFLIQYLSEIHNLCCNLLSLL